MRRPIRHRLTEERKSRNGLFWILVILSVVSLALTVTLIYRHISYKDRITQRTLSRAVNDTAKAARDLDEMFRPYMATAREIAGDISERRLSHQEVLNKIKGLVEADPHIHGIAIAYKPYAFNSRSRLYAPYCSRAEGDVRCIRVESLYDYTEPRYEWFSLPLDQGALWIEPYFGPAGATLMTTYSVPFNKIDRATGKTVPAGVVALDISLDEVKRIVESIDLGLGGYGAVISKKGVYLYHPNQTFVRERKTVYDVAEQYNDKDRIVAAERALKGGRGVIDHKSVTTGRLSWFLYEPIPSTTWSLHTTFIREDIPVDLDALRHQLMQIVLTSIIFLLSVVSLLLRVYEGDNGNLWKAASIGSAILLAGIGTLWQLALSYDTDLKIRGTRIESRVGLAAFVGSYEKSLSTVGEKPIYIPTGMFIHSMEFSGTNKISVNGVIWQKYPDGEGDTLARGFILPDAISDVSVKEIYSRKTKGGTVIGWHFSGALYEHFSYASYPVDHEVIRIRIGPKDVARHIVLVPDLDAYKFLNPGLTPGLEKNFVLPDWKIRTTFFELMPKGYDTTFGIPGSSTTGSAPDLYYNITIMRNLMDAFIRNMTPLIIVSLLLFAVMFISTEERMSRKFSMDIGENLVFVGSMFFVLVFTHISTRARIPTQEIFYLEYFYFTMYVALLWVPISSILFVTGSRAFYVQYKENLISKLLYWPTILAVLFALTLVTFY